MSQKYHFHLSKKSKVNIFDVISDISHKTVLRDIISDMYSK